VLERLERRTFVSVIDDPLLDRDELLKQLLQDFGVISKDRTRLTTTSRHDLIDALQHFLASLIPLDAHAVVIIDEAQHLQPAVLEQIRLLSNIDDEHGTMLQIILVGQTDLEPLLSLPELRQFQQRVSRRLQLEPLTPDEVHQYIDHRLAVAGGGHAPSLAFTPGAVEAVSTISGGLPRVINIVCDRALEAAYTEQIRTIDIADINAAARAVGLPEHAVPLGNEAEAFAIASDTPAIADDSVWPAIPFDAQAEDEGAAAVTPDRPGAWRGARKGAAIAASLAIATVGIWFGIRALNSPAEPQAAPAAAPRPSSPLAEPGGRPAIAAPETTATVPPPGGPGTATPRAPDTAASSAAPAAPAAPAAGASQRFEIVVASFRTNGPAASVAAAVEALGLPMRRRTADGWQQVLAGPFGSRAEADSAQQRLDRAGLEGAVIIQSDR
jgi:type II secretory pathway predicted ATPase ExeA